jgi:hypothetical protein
MVFLTLPRYTSPTAKLLSVFSLLSSTRLLSSNKAIVTSDNLESIINSLFKTLFLIVWKINHQQIQQNKKIDDITPKIAGIVKLGGNKEVALSINSGATSIRF